MSYSPIESKGLRLFLLPLHQSSFLGGGAGGSGCLFGGDVGLGDTPPSTFLPGRFRLEGGGFGTLTMFHQSFIFYDASQEFNDTDF